MALGQAAAAISSILKLHQASATKFITVFFHLSLMRSAPVAGKTVPRTVFLSGSNPQHMFHFARPFVLA